ncbi:MAG: KEOPS complex kinase/ATPase Bud32 [archaeon]
MKLKKSYESSQKSIIAQGAEAVIIKEGDNIIKQRIKKSYRIPELDEKIRKQRTRSEKKLLEKVMQFISAPKIIKTDEKNKEIIMEFIEGKKLSEHLDNFPLVEQKKICRQIGENTAKLHNADIIHSDLTTSNMILKNSKIFFIDFGLSYISKKFEDKAVDMHLFKQAIEAKHFKNWEVLLREFEKGYKFINKLEAEKVFNQLEKVGKRGRYKN